MNWLDFVLGILIAGVTVAQGVRGFGRAALDALALYAALCLANALAGALAAHLPSGTTPLACAYGLLLVSGGALGLLLSRWVYGMTLVHMGMFESLLGLVAGAAGGMMAAHGLVRGLTLADPTGMGSAVLVGSSFLGHEMLSFPTYHSMLNTLTGLTSSQRALPDVNA